MWLIILLSNPIYMDVKKIQDEIQKGKQLSKMSVEELKYVQKPIGKAIYDSSAKKTGRPRLENKVHWSDKVICDVCGVETLRSNQSTHKKSEKHLMYMKINKKLQDILLN